MAHLVGGGSTDSLEIASRSSTDSSPSAGGEFTVYVDQTIWLPAPDASTCAPLVHHMRPLPDLSADWHLVPVDVMT